MNTHSNLKIGDGVYQLTDDYPAINDADLEFLVNNISSTPKNRSRFRVHRDNGDRMQEMFIAFDGNTYVRPSLHLEKDESLHLISGMAKYIFFNDEGKIDFDLRIGNYHSSLPFYCRVPRNTFHGFVVMSKIAVAHEIIMGPFDVKSTYFPEWAADLQSQDEYLQYRKERSFQTVSPIVAARYKRITEEMCRADPGPFWLSRSDLVELKNIVPYTSRKRIRLCVHQTDNDALHEMFVVYTGNTFVRVNKHKGKDESLHILEGAADFVYFTDDGQIDSVISLDANGSNFFIRVPAGVFHTIIIKSEFIIIHEATPGPFDRSDTVWADWCPTDDRPEDQQAFLAKMLTAVENKE